MIYNKTAVQRYQEKNKERLNAYARKRYADSAEVRQRAKDYHFVQRYGITRAQRDEMLAKQGGRCAICQSTPSQRHTCVDHDHRTGEVRGILCTKCNTGLGMFSDNVDVIRRAARYIRGKFRGGE